MARSGVTPCWLRLLPPTLSLRGDAAQVRQADGRRAHAAGAHGEARGASRPRRHYLAESFGQVFRRVDVAGRTEVVAGHEPDGPSMEPFVRHATPLRAPEHEWMAPVVAVGGGDDSSLLPPDGEHAVHGPGGKIGAVREHDDCDVDVVCELV